MLGRSAEPGRAAARRRLHDELVELHAGLALLHNFATLNGEAVRKILKKHDKTLSGTSKHTDRRSSKQAHALLHPDKTTSDEKASRAYMDALAGCALARAIPVLEGMRGDVSDAPGGKNFGDAGIAGASSSRKDRRYRRSTLFAAVFARGDARAATDLLRALEAGHGRGERDLGLDVFVVGVQVGVILACVGAAAERASLVRRRRPIRFATSAERQFQTRENQDGGSRGRETRREPAGAAFATRPSLQALAPGGEDRVVNAAYRCLALTALASLGFAWDVAFWRRHKVNFRFIFQLPRVPLPRVREISSRRRARGRRLPRARRRAPSDAANFIVQRRSSRLVSRIRGRV